MQVITKIHTEKYDDFGGDFAAFDPVANLRVGVLVLREAIDRNGGLEPGLRQYVGAGNSGQDGGYVGKVLAEQQRLQDVANGKPVSITATKMPAEDALTDVSGKTNSFSPLNESTPSP
jgi:hypothetical protein